MRGQRTLKSCSAATLRVEVIGTEAALSPTLASSADVRQQQRRFEVEEDAVHGPRLFPVYTSPARTVHLLLLFSVGTKTVAVCLYPALHESGPFAGGDIQFAVTHFVTPSAAASPKSAAMRGATQYIDESRTLQIEVQLEKEPVPVVHPESCA